MKTIEIQETKLTPWTVARVGTVRNHQQQLRATRMRNSGGEISVPLAQPDSAMADEAAATALKPTTPSALFQEVVEVLQRVDEEALEYGSRLLAELFEAAYKSAIKPGMTKKKANDLPATTDMEREHLLAYGTVLINAHKAGFPRAWGALRDLALASAKSSWTFSKILQDRTSAAQAPRTAPANVWTQRTQPTSPTSPSTPLATQERYVFDAETYTAEEIERYREICEQPHVFPEATRQPNPDEWAIMTGIMSGKILARAMPQFLKRCCSLRQFTWFHQETVLRAEGELWTPLPTNSKMYNYNQSSRRIITEMRQSATHQQWSDERLAVMLDNIKAASYDKTRHALHLHFYTKEIAAQWEGMSVPFRASKLVLRNPDSHVGTSEVTTTASGAKVNDGLANDRYQAHYKIRLSNVPRTLDIDRLAAYLQELTGDAMKIGVPLDSYGQHSDWSLLCDLYGKTAACPPALQDIHRIMWADHPIMVQHRPSAGYAACLACAQIGHQMAACTTPEAERIGKTTLVVTAGQIERLSTHRSTWASSDEAFAVFQNLGQQPAPAADSSGGSDMKDKQLDATDVTENKSEHGQSDSTIGTNNGSSSERSAGSTNAAQEQASKSKNTWNTVGPNRGTKKKKSTAQKTNKQQAPDNEAPKTFRRGTAVDLSRVIDMTGDSDEDDEVSEEENDDDGRPVGADSHSQQSPSGSKGTQSGRGWNKKNQAVDKTQQELDDEAALQYALKLARLEKFRTVILEHVLQEEPCFSSSEFQAAITRALEHVQPASSEAWVLEAINGRLADTLGTGNCQFYAFAEAMHQQSMSAAADKGHLVETTMLAKYGLWLSSKLVDDEEELLCNMSDILATPNGVNVDESKPERQNRIATHFADLATSDSAVSSKLPEKLGGGWDTLRMLALLVDRPIFLISEHKGRHDVYLNVIQPQLGKKGNRTATILQPGTKEWLNMLRADGTTDGHAPLVLNYRNDHYDAILLDRHEPVLPLVATRRQTKITDLVPALPSVDDLINQSKTDAGRGATRREGLAGDASLTSDDLTDFLVNTSWSTVEKREIIGVLVSGATNLRELLTFSVVSIGEQSESEEADDDDDAMPDSSGSLFSPENVDSPMASQSSSQAFSLPSQGGRDYREWADEMWATVRETWLEQHNQTLPDLTDQVALRRLALAEPAVLCEIGRWCDHPLIFLDHFRPETIKEWMEAKRHQYLIERLTKIGDTVQDPTAREFLHRWLTGLRTSDDRTLVRAQLRDETAWSLLKVHAPLLLKGATAVPFVARDYSVKSAYIFVLDELFPSLARTVVATYGGQAFHDPHVPVSLPEAYQQSVELRTALDAAVKDKSWQPIEAFMTLLPLPEGEAAGSQY